jgi:hypothetical protein
MFIASNSPFKTKLSVGFQQNGSGRRNGLGHNIRSGVYEVDRCCFWGDWEVDGGLLAADQNSLNIR